MYTLTPKTRRVFDFLKRYMAANQQAPTIMEICEYLQRSIGSVHETLCDLEREGLIRRTRRWRGIEIVQ